MFDHEVIEPTYGVPEGDQVLHTDTANFGTVATKIRGNKTMAYPVIEVFPLKDTPGNGCAGVRYMRASFIRERKRLREEAGYPVVAETEALNRLLQQGG